MSSFGDLNLNILSILRNFIIFGPFKFHAQLS